MSEKWFTDEVVKELQAYVYRLIDPRTNQTFYIGKGRGNRVFQHAIDAQFTFDETSDVISPKIDLIREIHAAGLHVECIIHRHGLTDSVAHEIEASLIDSYDNLYNLIGGHYSSIRGAASVEEIQRRYNLPTCQLSNDHKIVLIKINKINGGRDRDQIYRLVRYCWKVNKARAAKADYVLAIDRGVIIGAFTVNQWLPATKENFPKLEYADNTEAHRWGFNGNWAPPAILDQYVGSDGKRLINFNLKSQYPVRYWNL